VLWRFMLELATRLGYRPELSRCVVCGAADDGWAGFSPELGGLVCRRCSAGDEPPAALAAGPEAAVLTELAETGLDAVTGRRFTPAARDDITRALGSFLERHAGRSMKLKSLEFLAQVRRLEEPKS